jgi:hypothetical protein
VSHKHEQLSGMDPAWLGSAICVLELWVNMGFWHEIYKFLCPVAPAISYF